MAFLALMLTLVSEAAVFPGSLNGRTPGLI